jgi:hypothetical protein
MLRPILHPELVQLGADNCTVIVGFNAQLLKYFVVLHLLSAWHDLQSMLAQLTSYLSREILGYDNRLSFVDRIVDALCVLRDKVLGQVVGIEPAEFGDLSVQRQNTADNLRPE